MDGKFRRQMPADLKAAIRRRADEMDERPTQWELLSPRVLVPAFGAACLVVFFYLTREPAIPMETLVAAHQEFADPDFAGEEGL